MLCFSFFLLKSKKKKVVVSQKAKKEEIKFQSFDGQTMVVDEMVGDVMRLNPPLTQHKCEEAPQFW